MPTFRPLERARIATILCNALVGPDLHSFCRSTRCQWQLQNAHTTADLRGLDYVGNGVAWASGTNGTVLRTDDMGAHWQICATPPNAEHLDFRGIQAFDNNTAIIMSSGKGVLSRLYKTTDSCQTWKVLFTNSDKDGFWDAIQFDRRVPSLPTSRYPQTGFLIGDPVNGRFAIFETNDGGEHWQSWESSGAAPPSDMGHHSAKAARDEALFAASNSALISPGLNGPFAFASGGQGGSHLFIPEPHSPFDNGTTWKFAAVRLPIPSNVSSGAFSMAVRELKPLESDVMVVGGDYERPASAGTSAFVPAHNECCFGLMPRSIIRPTTPPHGYRSSVAYDKSHNTWITVGPNGTDISTDDGRNWRPLKPNPQTGDPPDADQHWNALSLPFVVGPHGRIGKLEDTALAH